MEETEKINMELQKKLSSEFISKIQTYITKDIENPYKFKEDLSDKFKKDLFENNPWDTKNKIYFWKRKDIFWYESIAQNPKKEGFWKIVKEKADKEGGAIAVPSQVSWNDSLPNFLTNFAGNLLPVYKRTIRRYRQQVKNPIALVIKREAYDSDGTIMPGNFSLHFMDIKDKEKGLDAFWIILVQEERKEKGEL